MVTLELNPTEAELLLEMAEEWLWDLRQEVHHTETPDNRDRLKQKEALLERMFERLTTTVG